MTENGATKINETFTTVASANTYFTDDLKNLGAYTTSGGNLTVTVTVGEKIKGTANGYGVNLTLGVAPSAAAARMAFLRPEPGVESWVPDRGAMFDGAVAVVAPAAFAPPVVAAAPAVALGNAGTTHLLVASAGAWHQAVRSPPHMIM